MDFSDRLSALISDRGISTRELGRRIGVTHVTIGKWLRREAAPRGENLESLSDFFEVTPAFLIYGEEGVDGHQTIDIGDEEVSIPVIDVKASCGGGKPKPAGDAGSDVQSYAHLALFQAYESRQPANAAHRHGGRRLDVPRYCARRLRFHRHVSTKHFCRCPLCDSVRWINLRQAGHVQSGRDCSAHL